MVDGQQLGQAIKDARARAGLSQAALADAVGTSRVQLSYYETGRRQPPLTTLAAIARFLGMDTDELLSGAGPGDEEFDPSAVLFRAAPAAIEEPSSVGMRRFGAYVRGYLELLGELGAEPRGRQQSPFPPAKERAGKRDAARLAREVREYLGIGGGPLGDAFRVADGHCLVFRLPLGSDLRSAPSGFFYNHPDAGFCVVVNSDMSHGRQVFTVAHELGHTFFHSQESDVCISMAGAPAGRERFADLFAGELLVPGDTLRRLVDELPEWADVADPVAAVHLQQHFGVSYAALLVRLRQERLITEAEYQELGDVSPSKLARTLGFDVPSADLGEYECHPLDRLPDRMLHLVRLALRKGVITKGDAAEILGVSREEILQLVERPPAEEAERRLVDELGEVVLGD